MLMALPEYFCLKCGGRFTAPAPAPEKGVA
jgi:hypothetical protein